MDDKFPLSIVSDETPAEIPETEIPEVADSPFSAEEQSIKDGISAQFAALSDRDMLETILHNQISIRGTMEKMEHMSAQFSGMKPSDILKKMMGK